MNVWLLKISEPLPAGEASGDRLLRTGGFAQFLSEQGHRVTWWASGFDHARKQQQCARQTALNVGERLTIHLLRGVAYRANVSLARLLNHWQVARQFARWAPRLPPPDIIVSAWPTVELCDQSVRYGQRHKVPVVLDLRDMWPDVLVDAVPRAARPLARLLLQPMFASARRASAGAAAIIGITDAYVQWGLERSGRPRSALDRSFPLAYSSRTPPPTAIREAEQFWDGRGVRAEDKEITTCFVGMLGALGDLETIVQAANQARVRGKALRLVMCGEGDRREALERLAAGNPKVIFPGWVNAAQIHVLLRRCFAGLDPLPDRYDFIAAINNKAVEYLSAGLPLISSPRTGVLCKLLKQHQCGLSYDCGDTAALAAIFASLGEDTATRERMSANASRLFEEMFVAEKVYGGMMRYLEEVAASGRRQGG